MKKLLFASVACMAAIFACAFSVAYVDTLRFDAWGVEMAVMMAAGTTLGALAVLLVWGLPVHLFLKSKKMGSLLWYSIAGALPGIVIIGLFRPFGEDSLGTLVLQALYISVLGIVAALVFWKLERPRHA